MKTAIELPGKLLGQAKAKAQLNGQSMTEFVAAALRAAVARRSARNGRGRTGWKSVWGKAARRQVLDVDRIIEAEFSTVEADSWK